MFLLPSIMGVLFSLVNTPVQNFSFFRRFPPTVVGFRSHPDHLLDLRQVAGNLAGGAPVAKRSASADSTKQSRPTAP
jgi:hypothetical protein